ncbi:MAG TPA: glycosyltransferase family 1 protein [Acidimicrobiales bacterium]|nr:glycosyltransferase family 1 protein [Acidimicrobiales bacterium]
MSEPLAVSLDVSAVPANPAGAGRYTIDLVAALGRRDDTALTLIARRGDAGRWPGVAPGARVLAVSPNPRPARLAWEQTAMPAALAKAGVEVHHSPHYTMPERAAVPVVVTVHDLTFFDHPEWHERTKVALFRRAIRVAARRAAVVVCVSHVTAAHLHAVAPPRGRTVVVPHGVDHGRFRPDPDSEADLAVLEALGIRPPYVAFVGTAEPRKGIATLVEAFDRVAGGHRHLTLVLAGGAGWGDGGLNRAVAGARHAGRIVRPGYVADPVVAPLLRRAAAVAYPSLAEGFGLPALEALACGAPLVTTEGTAMAEVTGSAALHVPPGDAAALAGAIDALVSGDPALAARRQEGLAVAARYTWEASAEGHVAAYREAARATSGGRGRRQ